jgi:hypothetical protein
MGQFTLKITAVAKGSATVTVTCETVVATIAVTIR